MYFCNHRVHLSCSLLFFSQFSDSVNLFTCLTVLNFSLVLGTCPCFLVVAPKVHTEYNGQSCDQYHSGSTKLELLPSWTIYNLHSQVQSLGQRCWTSWLWCAFCRMVAWFVEVWVGENTEKVKVDFFTPFYVKSDSIFIGPESDHWECLSLTHWLELSD